MASVPAWLTARPIAHRGLHDVAAGRPENTAAAALAAIAGGFAIECDVQLSADGDAMVFHDDTLDRLTGEAGPVADRSAAMLDRLTIGGTAEPMPRLAAFLATIAGRVPLVCEVKSGFDGDMRLADRAAAILADYAGPVAIKSFDPAVLRHLRAVAPAGLPLGIVAEAHYADPEWDGLAPALKRDLAALAHFGETRPDFLSYWVADLPHAAATLMRVGLGRPVMAWTVRTPDQAARARLWADQMVFEGLVPDDRPQSPALV
ncbi:glycerophosphodiester phosphodiesterase family protein [Lichenihabitans sp. Uapishka_5]|uniref:glycerophosphodiester phosphodiesterase family protein n=1 Tax=Lichenihabitans sp. Uapishka_5 TaxID=3037302 RepID=UPI0029E81BEA|nr:glycerophosphodiester phosphodiesterase family protein [Lichenihabitans sp. Uapishka_5]MDX7952228.1 glycerophosphodiester phosphodiesterase family protein [Lichenihabitans sp. Uapishka_5]